jgi:hypothetical protein
VIAHIVRGSTGEYSDYRFWEVSAFSDKARADALCATLNAWCKESGVNHHPQGIPADDRYNLTCPYDPNFEVDYTGTMYEVWSIEVEQ